MRLAVVGSRSFQDEGVMWRVLDEIAPDSIVSGGASGADSLAEKYARDRGIPCEVIPAEWDKYGKSAGYRRNVQIVEESDEVVAFWDGESKGTKHTIDIADRAGKKVSVISNGSWVENYPGAPMPRVRPIPAPELLRLAKERLEERT